MTRLKFPTLILASVFALSQPSRTCAQTAPPSPPQPTPTQQAAASAKAAEQAAKEAQDAANAAQAKTKAQEAAAAAADARKAADAAKSTTDPQEAVKDAQQAIADAQKAAAAAAAAQSLATQTPAPAADCIAESEARVGIVDHWWRPQAGSDYLKLEYDVSSHQMRWFDYKHQGNPAGIEVLNGSVLPVVYSREKVLVHVNCLHPTDTVSITTNDVALPEQGADIRGVTPASSTATALAPTLDSLGSASAAGTALGTPGFGFGPPPTLASGTTSLFTPGSSKDGNTYVDAVVTIAPEDLAIEAHALLNDVTDAINSYNELETGKTTKFSTAQIADLTQGTKLLDMCPVPSALPGSVCALQAATGKLMKDLCPADGNCGGPADTGGASSLSNDFSLSGFNDYLFRTQTLVSQMNGLATGINQAGLPARAIAIRENMESIIGILAQVANTITDDQRYNGNLLGFLDGKNTITTNAKCSDLHDAISSGGILTGTLTVANPSDPKNPTVTHPKSNPADTTVCHAMEQFTLEQFSKRYNDALDALNSNGATIQEAKILIASTKEDLLNECPDPAGGACTAGNPGEQTALREFGKDLDIASGKNGAGQVSSKAVMEDSAKLADVLKNEHPVRSQAFADFSTALKHSALEQEFAPHIELQPQTPTSPDGSPTPTTEARSILVDDKSVIAVNQLFGALLDMRSQVGLLDQAVGSVFDQMNKRYENTWVDQTDALPTLTSNTNVRVGINVQRNFTPFTLTGGATVGTAAAAPASQQTASGSPGGGQQGGGQGGGQQGGGQQGGGKGSQSTGQQSSSQSPSSSPSGATSTTGSNDFTVLMEVHRFANFNLVGGVMGIHAKNYSFAAEPEYAPYTQTGTSTTPGSGGTSTTNYIFSAQGSCPVNTTPTTLVASSSNTTNTLPAPALYYCLQQTQIASIQPAGMLGIAWFPWHRDYFPRGRGALFQGRDMIPSFMAASSVTSLGSVFFGPNFEPFNGIDLFGGWATANVTRLAKGTSLTQVYLPGGSGSAAPTINTATQVKGGISFGVGFDISVFLQLFGKAQGPSLP
jgi:hypothetical protein